MQRRFWIVFLWMDFPRVMVVQHWSSALTELKSERMPYTVRMNNKIKEHGSPDLNSETVLGKQYGYASIFFTDFFVFRAFIFLSSLIFAGYLAVFQRESIAWIKSAFSVKFVATSLPFDFTCADVVLFRDVFEIRWWLKEEKKVHPSKNVKKRRAENETLVVEKQRKTRIKYSDSFHWWRFYCWYIFLQCVAF